MNSLVNLLMSYMILNVLYPRKKKELIFSVTPSLNSLDLVPHNLERASGAQHGKGGNYRQGSQKEYHDNVKEGRWIPNSAHYHSET